MKAFQDGHTISLLKILWIVKQTLSSS